MPEGRRKLSKLLAVTPSADADGLTLCLGPAHLEEVPAAPAEPRRAGGRGEGLTACPPWWLWSRQHPKSCPGSGGRRGARRWRCEASLLPAGLALLLRSCGPRTWGRNRWVRVQGEASNPLPPRSGGGVAWWMARARCVEWR